MVGLTNTVDVLGRSARDVTPGQHQRNLNVALSCALVIHHQKDVEEQILSDIEELAEFPLKAEPTCQEARTSLSALSLFQSSNFDDLVTERVSQSRCGHIFCGKKPRSIQSLSQVHEWCNPGHLDGFRDWCSDLCMEKSLWLRSQLRTEPAWKSTRKPNITLHPHERQLLAQVPPERSELPGSSTKDMATAELARERGESTVSWKPKQVMTAELVERSAVQAPEPPSAEDTVQRSKVVDGYTPANCESTEEAAEDIAHSEHLQVLPKVDELGGFGGNEEAEEESQWNDMFEHLRVTASTSQEPAVS